MKIDGVIGVLLVVLMAGCATKGASGSKIVVLETSDVTRAHDVVGSVSVSEQVAESAADTLKGLAGYATRDERVSSQIPSDTKAALNAKAVQYKEMIFEKLGTKAQSAGADAVIGARYHYVPAYVNLSQKATVSAEGTMIKYKK